MIISIEVGFPRGSAVKESACNVGNLGLISGLGRSLGKGKGYPLQYSGLENSMDCIIHGVAHSQTWLSNFDFHFSLVQFWSGWWWHHRMNFGGIPSFTVFWNNLKRIGISSSLYNCTTIFLQKNYHLSLHSWSLLIYYIAIVQSLSCVKLFATPWDAALQALLSSTISWTLLKFMSIELAMLSNHLILCCPFSFYLQSFAASGSFPMS